MWEILGTNQRGLGEMGDLGKAGMDLASWQDHHTGHIRNQEGEEDESRLRVEVPRPIATCSSRCVRTERQEDWDRKEQVTWPTSESPAFVLSLSLLRPQPIASLNWQAQVWSREGSEEGRLP